MAGSCCALYQLTSVEIDVLLLDAAVQRNMGCHLAACSMLMSLL